MTYEGISFLIPTFFSFVGFFAWIIVCRRMLNIHFPIWKVLLTAAWALAVLCMGVRDFISIHHAISEEEAIFVVLLKTAIRLGIIVLARVRYQELAKLHPIRLAMSPYEPTPSCLKEADYGVRLDA